MSICAFLTVGVPATFQTEVCATPLDEGRDHDALNPDFRFSCDRPNLLMLSDAFIHEGSDARNAPRRADTQWVKDKTGRFSYVSTGF